MVLEYISPLALTAPEAVICPWIVFWSVIALPNVVSPVVVKSVKVAATAVEAPITQLSMVPEFKSTFIAFWLLKLSWPVIVPPAKDNLVSAYAFTLPWVQSSVSDVPNESSSVIDVTLAPAPPNLIPELLISNLEPLFVL